MRKQLVYAFAVLAIGCVTLQAQEPVVGVADPEALFTSPNKMLNTNKQAVYHIMKDLLECNHWNEADKWLTAEYLQHNPNVKSGRAGVVAYFSAMRKPTPVPAKMKTKIVAVVAEGDLVVVATPRSFPDPRNPGKMYTTTWFDMWRMKGGKANEHWDGATITVRPPAKK
jgi:predicted SnoaL-like aldol condensation-catalyzing enzyme